MIIYVYLFCAFSLAIVFSRFLMSSVFIHIWTARFPFVKSEPKYTGTITCSYYDYIYFYYHVDMVYQVFFSQEIDITVPNLLSEKIQEFDPTRQLI